MNTENFKKFESLLMQLEPENLSCDGECSRSDMNRRRSAIMRQWRSIESELGRKVKEEEIWTHIYAEMEQVSL